MTPASADPAPQPPSLARSIALGGCVIVAFAAFLALVWYAAATLFLIFAGILFGVFLNALSHLLGRLIGGPYLLRLALVCALLTGIISSVVVLGGATIAQQASALTTTIRSQVGTVKSFLDQHGIDTSFLDPATALGPSTTPATDSTPRTKPELPSAGTIASGTTAVLGQTAKLLLGVFGTVGNIFVVVLLGVMLALQPDVYRNGMLSFVPRRHKAYAARLVDDVAETLRRWLLGQITTMSVIFLIAWTGLTIIGIPGALVLGFQAGLLTFIPTVGSFIAGIIIVLASLGSGWTAVISAFGLYASLQFLEGNILTPLIQRHAINIPPATLFASQIFLGVLFGLWGLALALPLIAVTKVVLKHVYGEADGKPAADTGARAAAA
ncbi:AI-2E family transporter [Bradyrhizobium sp. 2TAF24]|uniref:AI-2E family transporter n=1 Tax=Bradyrhizobium sp. 2TAF24 TaxID=3233011 RepID=UPI003F92BC9A